MSSSPNTFTIAIQPDAKPSISTYLGLDLGVMPVGIYSGGTVVQAPGRAVAVNPFTAKSIDGLTIRDINQEVVSIPAVSVNTIYWIVLQAIAWQPGDSSYSQHVEIDAIDDTTWQSYEYKPWCIVLAKVLATTDVPISPQNIDCSVIQFINFANTTGQLIFSGSSNFNGPTGEIITHNLGTFNYRVNVTPTAQAAVGYGDIWATKQSSTFTVFCDGDETTTFDWQLTMTQGNVSYPNTGMATTDSSNAIKLVFNTNHGALISFTYSLSAEPFTYNSIATTNTTNDSWAINCSTSNVPLRWKYIDSTVNDDLTIINVTITSGTGSHTHNFNTGDYRAFLIPLFANTNMPVISRANNVVSFTGDSGAYQLILVNSASRYLSGIASGTAVAVATHNQNLTNYVPLIALTSTSGDITGLGLTTGPNSFNATFTSGITAIFEWLIL